MYACVEGLPALGKTEVLALLRLYFPDLLILPELVKEVAERENFDLFRDRDRLTQALFEALPPRQALIRAALAEGRTVLEESHLGVHAAYSAALDDQKFLEAFSRWEQEILWPDVFLRFEAPLEVSLLRQKVRGDPRYTVPPEVLSRMSGWLSAWHARRGDRVEIIPADLSPEEVLAAILRTLGLRYTPHPVPDVIPYLILLGRPASGKTELIQFLKGLPTSERARAYHLGSLHVLDDFPILWEKFVEDDIWELLGRGRLHSRRCRENYAVADPLLWDFLLHKLNERLSSEPVRPGETVVLEFSRGGREAYAHALNLLPLAVLADGAILYLSVSYEESLRRNRARYDRDRRDGLLTHSVPEEEMAGTYREDDWAELAPKEAGYLTIRGHRVPYITVPNEPEPKTFGDFSRRFWPAMEELFWLWKNR
jgi:thymidylate kinase